jgi:hypothetical protein
LEKCSGYLLDSERVSGGQSSLQTLFNNPYTLSNSNSHPFANTLGYSNENAYASYHTNSKPYALSHGHSDRYTDANRNSDTDPYCYANFYPKSHTDAHSHARSHRNAHAHSYANINEIAFGDSPDPSSDRNPEARPTALCRFV